MRSYPPTLTCLFTDMHMNRIVAEYVERLKAAMKVVPGSNLSRRKWVLLGRRASVLFKKSPYLTSMLGSLDIAPPPPKVGGVSMQF